MAGQSSAGALRAHLLGTLNADGSITGVASGISKPIDCSLRPNLTLYVTASAALSAGTLIIEEADWGPAAPLYGGTYSQIDSVTLSTPFASAGGQYAYHIGGPGGSYAFAYVRVRIDTSVVGGTIIVVLRGC